MASRMEELKERLRAKGKLEGPSKDPSGNAFVVPLVDRTIPQGQPAFTEIQDSPNPTSPMTLRGYQELLAPPPPVKRAPLIDIDEVIGRGQTTEGFVEEGAPAPQGDHGKVVGEIRNWVRRHTKWDQVVKNILMEVKFPVGLRYVPVTLWASLKERVDRRLLDPRDPSLERAVRFCKERTTKLWATSKMAEFIVVTAFMGELDREM